MPMHISQQVRQCQWSCPGLAWGVLFSKQGSCLFASLIASPGADLAQPALRLEADSISGQNWMTLKPE